MLIALLPGFLVAITIDSPSFAAPFEENEKAKGEEKRRKREKRESA